MENILLAALGRRQEIAAVCAEDHGTNCSHFCGCCRMPGLQSCRRRFSSRFRAKVYQRDRLRIQLPEILAWHAAGVCGSHPGPAQARRARKPQGTSAENGLVLGSARLLWISLAWGSNFTNSVGQFCRQTPTNDLGKELGTRQRRSQPSSSPGEITAWQLRYSTLRDYHWVPARPVVEPATRDRPAMCCPRP